VEHPWVCSACTYVNDASKKSCEICGKTRDSDKDIAVRSVDWHCRKCNQFNFVKRDTCFNCGTKYESATSSRKSNNEAENILMDGRGEELNEMLRAKHGDWLCKKCKELNFGSRHICRKCSEIRPKILEQKKKKTEEGKHEDKKKKRKQ